MIRVTTTMNSKGLVWSDEDKPRASSDFLWELSREEWNHLAHRVAVEFVKRMEVSVHSDECYIIHLPQYARDEAELCKFKNDIDAWVSKIY